MFLGYNISGLLPSQLHPNKFHLGSNQIIGTFRRVTHAACLLAQPTLQEPIYLVEFQCTEDVIQDIYSQLDRKRGRVFSEKQQPGARMYTIKAYLPVSESFAFTAGLRRQTLVRGFQQSAVHVHHWETMQGCKPVLPWIG
jgi:elongation factor 2